MRQILTFLIVLTLFALNKNSFSQEVVNTGNAVWSNSDMAMDKIYGSCPKRSSQDAAEAFSRDGKIYSTFEKDGIFFLIRAFGPRFSSARLDYSVKKVPNPYGNKIPSWEIIPRISVKHNNTICWFIMGWDIGQVNISSFGSFQTKFIEIILDVEITYKGKTVKSIMAFDGQNIESLKFKNALSLNTLFPEEIEKNTFDGNVSVNITSLVNNCDPDGLFHQFSDYCENNLLTKTKYYEQSVFHKSQSTDNQSSSNASLTSSFSKTSQETNSYSQSTTNSNSLAEQNRLEEERKQQLRDEQKRKALQEQDNTIEKNKQSIDQSLNEIGNFFAQQNEAQQRLNEQARKEREEEDDKYEADSRKKMFSKNDLTKNYLKQPPNYPLCDAYLDSWAYEGIKGVYYDKYIVTTSNTVLDLNRQTLYKAQGEIVGVSKNGIVIDRRYEKIGMTGLYYWKTNDLATKKTNSFEVIALGSVVNQIDKYLLFYGPKAITICDITGRSPLLTYINKFKNAKGSIKEIRKYKTTSHTIGGYSIYLLQLKINDVYSCSFSPDIKYFVISKGYDTDELYYLNCLQQPADLSNYYPIQGFMQFINDTLIETCNSPISTGNTISYKILNIKNPSDIKEVKSYSFSYDKSKYKIFPYEVAIIDNRYLVYKVSSDTVIGSFFIIVDSETQKIVKEIKPQGCFSNYAEANKYNKMEITTWGFVANKMYYCLKVEEEIGHGINYRTLYSQTDYTIFYDFRKLLTE